jgi:hypothetical protein
VFNTEQIGANRIGDIATVDSRPVAPILCPTCSSVATPVDVKANPGRATIKLVCPDCEHQWNHVKSDHPNQHAAGRDYGT